MSKVIKFNTQPREWFSMALQPENKAADLYIYDEIGFFGVNSEDVVKQIANLDVEAINLHINSPGGSVYDGITIYNVLKNHKATVNVKIDGLAASIASIIAMAGDTIEVASNAMFMIHKPAVLMWGQAADLRKEADVLDKIEDTLVDTYTARTNVDKGNVIAWMAAETWFNADEAIEHGFADTKGEAKKAAASVNKWDLSLFANAPTLSEPESSAESDEDNAPPEKITPLSLLLRRQALIEKTINHKDHE